MLPNPLRQAWTANFLFALENELYIVVEQAQADFPLEGLEVHKQLAFIVIGPASPDSPVVDDRLERIAVPFLKRLGRLHVVMSVDQDGLRRRVYDFLSIDYRVPAAGAYFSPVCTCFQKQFAKSFGAALHICLVLRQGTH